jgi:hypothetical protein
MGDSGEVEHSFEGGGILALPVGKAVCAAAAEAQGSLTEMNG